MRRYLCCAALAAAICALPSMAAGSAYAAASHAHSREVRCIFDHHLLATKPGKCRPRAKHFPPGVTGDAEHAIYDSVLLFGIPYQVLLRIATCESGLNPDADNGSNFGLFQFAPATFDKGAAELYRATGVVAQNIWNALDNAYVAGYLFATGQSPQWSCQ